MSAISGKPNGAIVQRMSFKDTNICLINANLSSGNDEVQLRLQEIEKIYKEAFQKDRFYQVQGETIDSSELIILFGNLNFRLNLPDSSARITCDGMDNRMDSDWTDDEIRKIRELVEADEFVNCPADNAILANYIEGPLSFGPTYKYDPKTKKFSLESGYTCAW